MRLARVGAPGEERPAAYVDGSYLDLSTVVSDFDAGFWSDGGVARVREALGAARASLEPIEPNRIGAPLPRPGAVVCVGQNYAAHAAESGSAPPDQPIIFLKPSNTIAGPNDPVAIPRGAVKTDWEVELGVVIGRLTTMLDSPSASRDHIAGYVLANDVSEREYQLVHSGGQWSKGKSLPGFCPIGPWLVTADEVDPCAVGLRSWVNGEPRQDSSTADMIFGVDHLVWHLSHYLTLEPGDLILTGTPQGVALSGRFPYLRPGDVVELEADGLGRQRQEYVQ